MRYSQARSGVRYALLAISLSLAGLTGPVSAGKAGSSPNTADNPETGKQGETLPGEEKVLDRPYSKGVNVIGHSPIDGREGNLIMAWAGNCAYVANGVTLDKNGSLQVQGIGPTSGVAVIDASEPAQPRVTRYLQDKGAISATETLHAVTIGRRSILAASNYGGVIGMSAPKEGWLSLYDVTDCANPRLLSEVKWPEPVHTLTVSPSGRFVYGPLLDPFNGLGGIEVMDISDPTQPRFVGKFEATRSDGTSFQFSPHELVFSPDERRIYVGVVNSSGGDLNRHFKNTKPGVPSAESVGPDAGGIYIFDNTDFALGRPSPKLRLIGTAQQAGWHSPVRARIGGRPYLVNAGELGACPGAWPRITSIADERKPRAVGEFRLAMNQPENCPERTAMEKGSGGLIGRPGTASTHFQDVDDAANTRLGLFSFMFAGLRIADLRNPQAPREVAYFKPGDPCMSHVRYVRRTGHIWFACGSSGFYVIELKPELRRQLRLPRIATKH
ncbi:MAG: LVIVD repeat-containing protein [Novosphingobium sp.]